MTSGAWLRAQAPQPPPAAQAAAAPQAGQRPVFKSGVDLIAVDAIVVDITGNRGGTDWAEAAARVLTGPGLAAPRISFIKHPHWVKGIDSRLNDIELDLKRTTSGAAQRAWLLAART